MAIDVDTMAICFAYFGNDFFSLKIILLIFGKPNRNEFLYRLDHFFYCHIVWYIP